MERIRNRVRQAFVFFMMLALCQCGRDESDDPIPYVAFDPVIVNTNLPQYFALQSDGGSIALNEGGVRGIILYRENETTIRAFERNCSFQPNTACATVDIHSTTLYMHCTCCESSFNFEGDPQGGPAWRPLRQYSTERAGSQITVTDHVIN